MDETTQRITIAELCGWKWWKHTKSETYIFGHPERDKPSLDDDKMQWETCGRPNKLPETCLFGLPDFHGDLNAMRHAEALLILKPARAQDYSFELDRLCDDYGEYHASAPQRAEALLRTLNLWEQADE